MRVPEGVLLASPTLSPDELEVLYAQSGEEGSQIRRSARSALNAPFPTGEVVAELEPSPASPQYRCSPFNGTQRLSIDLSGDGLTAYLVCASVPPFAPSAYVRVARRPGIAAAFVVDPQDYGQAGPDFSISADELGGYSSAIRYDRPPGTPVQPGAYSPRFYPRSTKSATFGEIPGAGSSVPGLETLSLVAPDPSPDGLWLFGLGEGGIAVAGRERLDAPFGAPSVVLTSDNQVGRLLFDPEVSEDCRRLYYIKRESGPPPAYGTYTLRVATR
jgi:hypothetical protein